MMMTMTASDVEMVIGEDLDARAERNVLEIIRRIRDKHRARAGQPKHSRRV